MAAKYVGTIMYTYLLLVLLVVGLSGDTDVG